MDAMIQQTINGYTSVFDSLPVSDPALQDEIAAFRKELDALGESSADVMAFMTGMQTGAISERYSNLISRASAPPVQAADGTAPAAAGAG
jgi:hypothetical protein